MTGGAPTFLVEVRCALRERQEVSQVRVAPGDTVAGAVQRCGILARFPELDPSGISFAIHGARATGEQQLRPGDRIDLVRPLAADPRETRRRRARRRAGGASASAAANERAGASRDDAH